MVVVMGYTEIIIHAGPDCRYALHVFGCVTHIVDFRVSQCSLLSPLASGKAAATKGLASSQRSGHSFALYMVLSAANEYFYTQQKAQHGPVTLAEL